MNGFFSSPLPEVDVDDDTEEIQDEYFINDQVEIKLSDSRLVRKFQKYDDIISVTIIGKSYETMAVEYVAYIPSYDAHRIIDCILIDRKIAFDYKLDKKFMNEFMTIIYRDHVHKLTHDSQDGKHCVKCGEFTRMAGANQPDGAFICYGCRTRR